MRITIWVPDKLVEGLKEAAHKHRKSVSGYLTGLHMAGAVRIPASSSSLLDAPIKLGKQKTPKPGDNGYFNPMPKGGK